MATFYCWSKVPTLETRLACAVMHNQTHVTVLSKSIEKSPDGNSKGQLEAQKTNLIKEQVADTV